MSGPATPLLQRLQTWHNNGLGCSLPPQPNSPSNFVVYLRMLKKKKKKKKEGEREKKERKEEKKRVSESYERRV
jgi:hypothetical protein